MAYEHAREVNQAAKALLKVIDLAMKGDPQEVAKFLLFSDALKKFQDVAEAAKGEVKAEYKAKLYIKLGLALSSQGIDQILPDDKS